MAKSSMHLNGNILCAIDTETTGLDPRKNELWQICVLPLDSTYKPNPDIIPFYQDIKVTLPDNIEPKAIKLSKGDFALRQKRALDAGFVADMFDEWFQKLNLPLYKKIVPLAQNWPFDRSFIMEWLGPLSFNDFFSPHYRDTMMAEIFMTDVKDYKCEYIDRNRFNLGMLCSYYNVTNHKHHDALQDCLATAEVYRRQLGYAS